MNPTLSPSHQHQVKEAAPVMHPSSLGFLSSSALPTAENPKKVTMRFQTIPPRRTPEVPALSLPIENSIPPAKLVVTNPKKASSQKPPKKKHQPDDEDEWKVEPELPGDMRMWWPFSDHLATFPKRDPKKKGRFIRKDEVARMLRFLISRLGNIDLASNPSSCCNCRKAVTRIEEAVVKPGEDLPPPKKPVPIPEEDLTPTLPSSHLPKFDYRALWPDKTRLGIGNSLVEEMIPEDMVPGPHHSPCEDNPAKLLPPTEGPKSSQTKPHVEGRTPNRPSLPPPLPLPLDADAANPPEEDNILHPPAVNWKDSEAPV